LARRGGYDTDAVEVWARSQAQQVTSAQEQLATSQAANADLRAMLEETTEKLRTLKRPDFAGLSAHATQLLALAEAEAAEIREQAQRHAEQSKSLAAEEAQSLRAHAAEEAAATLTTAHAAHQARRDETKAELEALRHSAERESADLRVAAEQEASRLMLAAEQESEALRLSARREVDQVRAAADREVTEARRVLAVEKERLAREANEYHNVAVEKTAKLVSDTEARAAAADELAASALAAAKSARDNAGREATRIIEGAEGRAAAILAEAQAEAERARGAGIQEAGHRARALADEIASLERRRTSVLDQLARLRDIAALAHEPLTDADQLEDDDEDSEDRVEERVAD
jgi:hypothetical protein